VRTDDVLFSWSPVVGAAAYKFQVSSSPSFATFVEQQDTVMTSWAPVARYTDGATYYWRVRVLDGAGNVLATSGTSSFLKDATPPTVSAVAPLTEVALLGPVTVTMSEPVTGVGNGSVVVTPVGSAAALAGTVNVSGSTLTWRPVSALTPGQSYTVHVPDTVTDLAGNPAAANSSTVRAALSVENDAPAWVRHWDSDSAAGASGGTSISASRAGDTVTLAFTGTSVSAKGLKAPAGGYSDVYVDGVRRVTASSYRSAAAYQQLLFSVGGLSSAAHVLQVRVLGTKPTGATGTNVDLDVFTVGTTPVQDTSAAVVQGFARVPTSSASGGSYDLLAFSATGDNGGKPMADVRFYGTGVSWYATKSNRSGKAAVYVDGALKATVDLYASATTYKATAWTSPTLTKGLHTLRIVSLGAKGATASAGTDVSIDRVLVR
jgi:hypothetical protein